jgi:hypothetical protein
MSNRDGRRARRRKVEKLSMAKAGDPCPNCAKFISKKKKSNRKLKLDADGHAIPIFAKITRLDKAGCANECGHEHHVHCPSCNWTNF